MQVLLNQLDKGEWNDFLRKQTHSHFWHTWEWGEFLASFKQRETLRFSLHDTGGDVVGLSTVCTVPLPGSESEVIQYLCIILVDQSSKTVWT